MSLTRRSFALHLALTPGVGGKSVTRVLARNDLLNRTPEDFLSLSPEAMREEYKLKPNAAQKLSAEGIEGTTATLATERKLDGLGVNLVTAADAHYPSLIEQMDPDPPGVLFLYGNHKLLETKTFAVMSSRSTSRAGLDLVEKLTEQGVLSGEILVTGHDRPEYQRSAVVPLRWGAPRVLVLDRGLFKVLGPDLKDEAFRAARLWRYQFDPTTDLVVSAFRPESDFIGVNNKLRDRVVACLARRIDFVEVAEGGNMERLIKLGQKAGRPVRLSDRSIGYRAHRESGVPIIEG